jgi:hypothetical protein
MTSHFCLQSFFVAHCFIPELLEFEFKRISHCCKQVDGSKPKRSSKPRPSVTAQVSQGQEGEEKATSEGGTKKPRKSRAKVKSEDESEREQEVKKRCVTQVLSHFYGMDVSACS